MLGILSIVKSLFYPTDDECVDGQLAYYRQREWRITGNFFVNNKPRARQLSEHERRCLLDVDGRFWKRELSFQNETFRRADKALSLVLPPAEDVWSMITRLVVPSEFKRQAEKLFADVLVETAPI